MSSKSSNTRKPLPTLPSKATLDLYFLDARHRLIELAAFLDRIERGNVSAGGTSNPVDDFRLKAFRDAAQILADDQSDKARRIQMIFSDPTEEPLESAAGMKGAVGAWKPTEKAKL